MQTPRRNDDKQSFTESLHTRLFRRFAYTTEFNPAFNPLQETSLREVGFIHLSAPGSQTEDFSAPEALALPTPPTPAPRNQVFRKAAQALAGQAGTLRASPGLQGQSLHPLLPGLLQFYDSIIYKSVF